MRERRARGCSMTVRLREKPPALASPDAAVPGLPRLSCPEAGAITLSVLCLCSIGTVFSEHVQSASQRIGVKVFEACPRGGGRRSTWFFITLKTRIYHRLGKFLVARKRAIYQLGRLLAPVYQAIYRDAQETCQLQTC